MARRDWIRDRLLVEAPERVDIWASHIAEAWDCVVKSRAACLAEDWPETDRWARKACVTAALALCFSRGWEPLIEFTDRVARDYVFDTFGSQTEEVFARARFVGDLLPVANDVGADKPDLLARTVAAASEIVARVECQILVEQRPPVPTDPHVLYPTPRPLRH